MTELRDYRLISDDDLMELQVVTAREFLVLGAVAGRDESLVPVSLLRRKLRGRLDDEAFDDAALALLDAGLVEGRRDRCPGDPPSWACVRRPLSPEVYTHLMLAGVSRGDD